MSYEFTIRILIGGDAYTFSLFNLVLQYVIKGFIENEFSKERILSSVDTLACEEIIFYHTSQHNKFKYLDNLVSVSNNIS